MSNTKTELNEKTGRPKVSRRGGARAGAGRPRGSTDKITIAGLLEAVDTTAGRPYVQVLAEDFVRARGTDPHLAQKYHNLILNKVAATLAVVEVTETDDAVARKAEAFAEALRVMSGSAGGT